MRLLVNGVAIRALVDTGSDRTALPEDFARLADIPYEESRPTFGVSGPVRTSEASQPLRVAVFAPRVFRGRIKWLHLGAHELRPLVIAAPFDLPALVGRSDLLVHYRFVLEESSGAFDLRLL